jgi:nicotinamidase/pyrazinamidase
MKRFLIIVDLQNDFCPGGSLAVKKGALIVDRVNYLAAKGGFDHIIATQDWHPKEHISFASAHDMKPFESVETDYGTQALWPEHCVQKTKGAELRPDLDMAPIQFIVRKGFRHDVDSYSAFRENDKKTMTGLDGLITGLRGDDDCEIVLCGIATDVCVAASAMDALRLPGKKHVTVALDASAAVSAAGEAKAVAEMRAAGITLTDAGNIVAAVDMRKGPR